MEKKYGTIYKITNVVNGKIYIGQTVQTLHQRWLRHCSKTGGSCSYLHRAILKYGKENFKIEVIMETEQDFLNVTEQFYIHHYKSTDHRIGYNLTEGGKTTSPALRALTKEQETKIIAWKESGQSCAEIAKEFNIDKTTVANIFKRQGKKMPNKRNLSGRVSLTDFVSFIRDAHPTCKEVEYKFGISKCSVYNLLRKINNPSLKLRLGKRKSSAEIYLDDIVEKYKQGYNIQDLIKIFHCNKKYISKALHKAGITIQRGKKSIEYNSSKSVQSLAEKTVG